MKHGTLAWFQRNLGKKTTNHEQFYENFEKENLFGTIVKSQLHFEAAISELVEVSLPNSDVLLKLNLRFNQLVDLAVGLERLHKEIAHALKALNKFRNNFAHNLSYRLTEEDWKNFTNEMSLGLQEGAALFGSEEDSLEDRIKAYIYALDMNVVDAFIAADGPRILREKRQVEWEWLGKFGGGHHPHFSIRLMF